MPYNHQDFVKSAQNAVSNARFFKIVLSIKTDLQCDASELPAVIQAIKSGMPVKLKQGLFNPSYWVATVEDKERHAEYHKKVFEVVSHNDQNVKYGGGRNLRNIPKMESLKDIFEGLPLNYIPDKVDGDVKYKYNPKLS